MQRRWRDRNQVTGSRSCVSRLTAVALRFEVVAGAGGEGGARRGGHAQLTWPSALVQTTLRYGYAERLGDSRGVPPSAS